MVTSGAAIRHAPRGATVAVRFNPDSGAGPTLFGGSTVTSITVAICTRNRPDELGRALHSVQEQTLPPTDILVVDNAPGDDSTETRLRREFPDVRYVREPIQGLDFARNQALRSSAADVVAFLDDDAVADPAWLQAIHAVFDASPETGVCTGRILPLDLSTAAQRLFEANGGLFASSPSRRTLPGHPAGLRRLIPTVALALGAGSGCNLAVRRTLALELGGFDEALDLGAALPGGGDNEMVWRMLEGGALVEYEPTAVVRHEHRRGHEAVIRQILGHQRAAVAVVAKAAWHTRGVRRLPVVAFLGWRLLKPGVRVVRGAVGHDPLPPRVLFRMWVECVRGLWAYPTARAIALRRRQPSTPVPELADGERRTDADRAAREAS